MSFHKHPINNFYEKHEDREKLFNSHNLFLEVKNNKLQTQTFFNIFLGEWKLLNRFSVLDNKDNLCGVV